MNDPREICMPCGCPYPKLGDTQNCEHGYPGDNEGNPRPASMLQPVTFAGGGDDSARRVRFRPVDEAEDEW